MERGIGEFIKAFEQESDAILRDATQRVSNGLVSTSVVDTGEMVADWDVAIGDWPSDTRQPADPRRSTTRARLKSGFKDIKMGQSIFFENTDPAAVQQEIGNWRSAPNGLTRLMARRWRGFVKGAGMAAQNRVKKNLVFD